jgi:two-component system sensor histidine kinase YesM
VENAIEHGILPGAKDGRIEISARIAEDALLLTVRDYGRGMPPDCVDEVLSKTTEGFGLRGTASRLRLFYGTEDVLTIHTGIDEGTSILLRLPLTNNNQKMDA